MNTRTLKSTVWLVFFSVFFCISFPISSKTASEKGASDVTRWNNDVALTNAQKTAVLTLATSFALRCDSINGLLSTPSQQREEMKSVAHNAYLSSVEGLLTTSQKQQLATKKTERANVLSAQAAQQNTEQTNEQTTEQSNQ